VRKLFKRSLLIAPALSVVTYAVYAWAATNQANLRVDAISGSHAQANQNGYTLTVINGGNASAYNVRMSFRIPEELASQNSSLPSPGAQSSINPTGTGKNPNCGGATTISTHRLVICTADRLDVNDVWTITIPVINSGQAGPYFANAQVFSDVPEGTTVGSTNMTDNQGHRLLDREQRLRARGLPTR